VAESTAPATRIGVAIDIPEPWGSELTRRRGAAGDPQAAYVPAHVTLLGPTEVDTDLLPAVEKHLEAVASAHRPFTVHLRGTGTFRPVSPVVFVTLAEGISSCEVLADAVRSGPLDVDLNFPYHPHVTIAHHLDDATLDKAFGELQDFECAFDASSFSLYIHDDSLGWVPTREFELG
jgi:2'-5' RNA ligase